VPDPQDSNKTGGTPGFDSLIEDLFGLNVRGLKTVGQLFISPKKVFESARVPDWRRKYTPTIRLTFSIITVFMLLSFFWAAEDGMMYQALFAQFTEIAAASLDPVSPEQIRRDIRTAFAAYSFFYPFIYMLLHGLVGSALFIWGKGTGWVTRLRLYFGLLTVGMTVALISTLITPFLRPDMLVAFTFFGMAISVLAYWLTYARGMWGSASALGVLIRATCLALLITLVDIIVSGTAGIGAGIWVGVTNA